MATGKRHIERSPFGRRKITSYDIHAANDEWRDLGDRHARFESQPPCGVNRFERANLTKRDREALREIQRAIDVYFTAGSGSWTQGTRHRGPRRLSSAWQTDPAAATKGLLERRAFQPMLCETYAAPSQRTKAAETPAQVIHLTPASGMRRAA